jgi:hypothetical protein
MSLLPPTLSKVAGNPQGNHRFCHL